MPPFADEPYPAPTPPLSGDVSVVDFSIALEAAALAAAERLLSAAERDRAARLAPHVARRFVAARGQLRRILARVLDADPESIEIELGPRGKPMVGGRHAGRCHFNLSHARDRCLVAVSRRFVLGIDLELRAASHTTDWAAMMAGSILAAAELPAYRALPEADRPTAVLEAWVAKEAVLKAEGEGIAAGVRHLVLPTPLPRTRLVADAVPRPASLATVAAAAGRFGVCLLDTAAGGHAALACAATDCRVALVPPERLGLAEES